MPCKCSARKSRDVRPAVIAGLAAVTWYAASAAADETKSCALTSPKHETKGDAATFEITIDCGDKAPNAKKFPVGTEILVGLTIYSSAGTPAALRDGDPFFGKRLLDAPPEISSAMKGLPQSKAKGPGGGPKWITLADEDVKSFDLPAQTVKIEGTTTKLSVKFSAGDKEVGANRYMLFAAWPVSQRTQCEKDSEYARSGCKRDGYVIGDGAGVSPIAAYPGIEINKFEHPAGGWTVERWIVERYR